MGYRLRLVFILFLTLSAQLLLGQEDQGGFLTPADSLGQVLPKKNIIYLPSEGFSFYESPLGDFKGKILPGPPLQQKEDGTVDTLLMATLVGNQIRSTVLYPEAFFESTDSCFHLAFSQQRDDFLFINSDQFQGWISLDEVRKKGFKIISWMHFYGESKGRMIHPREKTIAVKSVASDKAALVDTADELYSEITSTGKCENNYCFVKIVEYKNPYDPTKPKEENILKKYKGWIKIIDEEGKPLVAHNH